MTMTTRTLADELCAQAYQRGYAAARLEAPPAPVTPVCPGPPATVPATFVQLLTRHRTARGISCYKLAKAAGCDPSYLTRIELEQQPPPRRPLVDALARVLRLRGFAYRQFVTAAGYTPVREWTPQLEAAYGGRKS